MSDSTKTTAARLQAESREPEPLYRSLFEDSVAFICIHKLDGTLLAVNPAAAKSLGFPAEVAVGHSIRDFMPPDSGPNFEAYLERLRRNGRDAGEMHVVARDGSIRVWSYSNVVRQQPDGEPYVIGHAVDGTELRAATVMLQASEERYRRLSEELQEALARVRTLTGLLPICAACKKIRDDHGNWNHVESYIRERSEAQFTHGICPDCAKRLYPDDYKK
jgi:PAS domain S-box-containing protein